jgi:hypothetical protein
MFMDVFIKPVQACTCSLRHAWAPTFLSTLWVGRDGYWAVQIWGFDGRGHRNDCDPLESAADAPWHSSLGWPHPLSYADTLAQATRLSGKPVIVVSGYRMTDGGFKSHVIRAAARVEFHYDNPNPQAGDTVAAIELGLVGDRRERYLAEIRAINHENQLRVRQCFGHSGSGRRRCPIVDS